MRESNNIEGESQREWNVTDELNLLNAISNCGYGNWSTISTKVPHFSSSDCEKHYHNKFLCDVKRGPALCSNNCKLEVEPLSEIPYNCSNISEINEFVRNLAKEEYGHMPSKHPHQKSQNYNKFCSYMVAFPNIGYNRVRSDFEIEYDNNAEGVLKMISENHLEKVDLDEEESSMFQELEYALFQSYNERLRQRYFRKRIVRDHCLIDRRKTFNMLQRLDVPFGNKSLKVLIPLLRFLNGPEFDLLVEKLKYQNELKLKMSLLMEYRSNGLKYFNDITIYKKLKGKRFNYNTELACLSKEIKKKPSQPLVLGHLPGYNQLNEEEKNLCSSARIVPETYINFKEVLIAECEKYNGLRLAQARNLIKIDVNKTRKIYDYLLSLNFIWQPDSSVFQIK